MLANAFRISIDGHLSGYPLMAQVCDLLCPENIGGASHVAVCDCRSLKVAVCLEPPKGYLPCPGIFILNKNTGNERFVVVRNKSYSIYVL